MTIGDDDAPDPQLVDPVATVSVVRSGTRPRRAPRATRPAWSSPRSAHSARRRVSVDFATARGNGDVAATSRRPPVISPSAAAPPATPFNLVTVGDYADEPDETLTVGLLVAGQRPLPAALQTLTIADDDLAVRGARYARVAGAGRPRLHERRHPRRKRTADPTTTRSTRAATRTGSSSTRHENDGTTYDLHGRVDAQSIANDSPSSGDIDLCVRR